MEERGRVDASVNGSSGDLAPDDELPLYKMSSWPLCLDHRYLGAAEVRSAQSLSDLRCCVSLLQSRYGRELKFVIAAGGFSPTTMDKEWNVVKVEVG